MAKTKRKTVSKKRQSFLSRILSKPQSVSLLIVVVLVAVVGGYAAVRSSHTSTDIRDVCMALYPGACLKGNGSYNYVTAERSAWTNWTVYDLSGRDFMMQSDAGNCLRIADSPSNGTSPNQRWKVEVGSTRCNSSDWRERWNVTTGTSREIKNDYTGCYLAASDSDPWPKQVFCISAPYGGIDWHWNWLFIT